MGMGDLGYVRIEERSFHQLEHMQCAIPCPFGIFGHPQDTAKLGVNILTPQVKKLEV